MKFAALGVLILAIWCNSALAQGIPIGALPAATSVSGSDLTIISQVGVTKSATALQLGRVAITIANNTLLGNVSGGTAAATGLTAGQVDTLLGLGTAAFVNTGAGGHTLPFLDGSNTWSALQTFSGGISLSSLSIGTLSVTGTTNLGNASADYVVVTGGASFGTIATNAGGLTLAPFSAATSVTGSLAATTTLTAGTGLTITTGGATITGNSTITGTLGGLTGLTVASGGASITGNTSILSGSFTASGGAFTASPSSANVVMSPTGTGVVTISPSTAGTMNNMVIGGSTPLAGTFTVATANSFVPNSSTVPANGLYLPAANNPGLSANTTKVLDCISTGCTHTGTLAVTGTSSLGTGSTDYLTAAGGASGGALSTNAGAITISSGGGASTTLSDSAITFSNAAYHSCTGFTTNSSGLIACATTSSVYPAWGGVKTTAFNATAGTAYCVDTKTTGAVTMTLPGSPADGDQIRFIDCKHNFGITNFTVARNGNTIMGLAADMTVNNTNVSATLVWSSTVSDWVMY